MVSAFAFGAPNGEMVKMVKAKQVDPCCGRRVRYGKALPY